MAKGKPLSAAHKAAISAGLKRYWASRSGGRSPSNSSGKRGSPVSFIPGPFLKTGAKSGSNKQPVISKIGAPKPVTHLETGKPISREAAARIMFGSKGAAKKKAAGRKVKR